MLGCEELITAKYFFKMRPKRNCISVHTERLFEVE